MIENINHMAIEQLRLLGFSMVNVRQALPKLTGLKQQEVARRVGVSRPLVTLAMRTGGHNPVLREKIAAEYQVPVEVLFSDLPMVGN